MSKIVLFMRKAQSTCDGAKWDESKHPRKDNGQFYRDADGNCATWDLATNAPGVCVDGVVTIGAEKPALEGCYEIDGVEVWTEFEAMKAEYAKYTDEFVQQTTGAPGFMATSPVIMPTFSLPNTSARSKNFSLTSAFMGAV